MNNLKFVRNWDVIDLLELVKEISNDDDNHPVMTEWQYYIYGKSNGVGELVWVGENDVTPIINEYLLTCGYTQGDKVLFWLCW